MIKGRAPTAKDPGRGPLTLRLRDVDFADVFQALAVLGGGGFVVHESVVGRVSLEVTRATLDETLAAIRKASGAEISDAGPVRVVSTARLATRSDAPAGGAPASFALKHVEVRDLLAGMADVDPGLAALGPPGFLGRVSVWTQDAPLLRGSLGRPGCGRAHGANRGGPPRRGAAHGRGRGAASRGARRPRAAPGAAPRGADGARVPARGRRLGGRELRRLRLRAHGTALRVPARGPSRGRRRARGRVDRRPAGDRGRAATHPAPRRCRTEPSHRRAVQASCPRPTARAWTRLSG